MLEGNPTALEPQEVEECKPIRSKRLPNSQQVEPTKHRARPPDTYRGRHIILQIIILPVSERKVLGQPSPNIGPPTTPH
jgi:hypothetical protein